MELPAEIFYAIVDACDSLPSRLNASLVNRRVYYNRCGHIIAEIRSIAPEIEAQLKLCLLRACPKWRALKLCEHMYQRVRHDAYFYHEWRRYYLREVGRVVVRECIRNRMALLFTGASRFSFEVFMSYDAYRETIPDVQIASDYVRSVATDAVCECKVFARLYKTLATMWYPSMIPIVGRLFWSYGVDKMLLPYYMEFSQYAWKCAIPRRRTGRNTFPACGTSIVDGAVTRWFEDVDELLFLGAFFYYHRSRVGDRNVQLSANVQSLFNAEATLFEKWAKDANPHTKQRLSPITHHDFQSFLTIAASDWKQLLLDIRSVAIALVEEAFTLNLSRDRFESVARVFFDDCKLQLWIHDGERTWLKTAKSHPFFRAR